MAVLDHSGESQSGLGQDGDKGDDGELHFEFGDVGIGGVFGWLDVEDC